MTSVQWWDKPFDDSLWKRDRYLNTIIGYVNNIKILSLDVFDTLLLRTCEKPVDVFYLLGQQAIQMQLVRNGLTAKEFQEIRILAERKARFRLKKEAGHDEVTFEQIYEMLPQNIGDRAKIMNLELEVERQVCYLNPNIESLIKSVKKNGTKIVLLSDMYLSSEQIKRLISSSGLEESLIDFMFVSNEEGGGKANGNLFHKMVTRFPNENIDAYLHIGDSADADVYGAIQFGIKAIHYKVIPSDFEGVFEWEKVRHHDILPQLQSIRKLAGATSAEYPEDDQFWFRFGAEVYGPFLAAYCDWILDICVQERRKAIYPFLREGILLTGMLKKAAQMRRLDIKIEPLYVSRQATFLAGLDAFDEEHFGNLFERNHFTVADLIRMLELEKELQAYLDFAHIPLSESAKIVLSQGGNLKQSLKNVLTSSVVQEKIREVIDKRRNDLVQYLQQSCNSFDGIVTVDLGFKGTIQRSINAALKISGIPFDISHLLAVGGEETKHHLLAGLDIRGFTGNSGENHDLIKTIMRSPEFLEELLMGEIGSTLGYEQHQGASKPILGKLKYGEEEIRKKQICQEGVMAFQAYWYYLKEKKSQLMKIPDASNRDFAKLIHRVIDMPTAEEAHQFGGLTHDDNFGSEHASSICTKEDLELCNRLGSEHFLELGRFGFKATEVYWPQGVVTRSDPAVIFRHYLKNSTAHGYLYMMSHLVSNLRQAHIHEITIYGAGDVGQSLLKIARLNQIKVAYFVDRKPSLWGQKIDGVEVISLTSALSKNINVFAVGSLSFISDIIMDIRTKFQDVGRSPQIFSLQIGKEAQG
ncbi:HAD hydrolase-like protein [Paenibacillus validus]|nr:HAD family hydrolase [Paenibacillus validus]MED4601247.1 HAD hydrolase-like protein [Paenibacillus validus]MED4605452.1 HAD hydrolase-like protein [Paenibacillus validus]